MQQGQMSESETRAYATYLRLLYLLEAKYVDVTPTWWQNAAVLTQNFLVRQHLVLLWKAWSHGCWYCGQKFGISQGQVTIKILLFKMEKYCYAEERSLLQNSGSVLGFYCWGLPEMPLKVSFHLLKWQRNLHCNLHLLQNLLLVWNPAENW